jgi:hypothetical protein
MDFLHHKSTRAGAVIGRCLCPGLGVTVRFCDVFPFARRPDPSSGAHQVGLSLSV